jgi:hypothetical protein
LRNDIFCQTGGLCRSLWPEGISGPQAVLSFFLGYYTRYGEVLGFAYGLAGDASGNVFVVSYQARAFPAVAPTRHTQVMDDNHTRVTGCIKPVALDKTRQGLLACITPVNQQESDDIARQKPVDATVCAVLENPASFNNKLVRIRGHFSGNFEYSMLSGDGCKDALWFGYGGGGGPPSLAVYVGGGARPGSEDSEDKLVLPSPGESDPRFVIRLRSEDQKIIHAVGFHEIL